jgi:hypothetical protein
LTSLTADRVLISGSDKEVKASSTTVTQLSYLDATSSIQTQLNNADFNTFEKVSKNLKNYPYALNYTVDDLTSVVYDLGGGLFITKTLNYSLGKVTSIVLSGDTPSGILLTKTLTYTVDKLTGVAYS